MLKQKEIEMKKSKMAFALATAAAAAVGLTGCSVNTSGNIDINTSDIQYRQDERTGLCFAFSASRKTGEIDTTGLGLTEVPCTDEVLALAR